MTDSADSPSIPRYIVDDLLLGSVRKDVIKRFTPNIDIVSDVWVEFARCCREPVRVLISPCDGVSATDIGFVLHDCIREYRGRPEARNALGTPTRDSPNISPLENFVAVTLYLDELVRVVLPITRLWSERNLSALNRKSKNSSTLRRMLEAEIRTALVKDENQKKGTPERRDREQRKVMEAAPLAALIGLLVAAARDSHLLDGWDTSKEKYRDRLKERTDTIAQTAVATLALDILPCLLAPKLSVASEQAAKRTDPDAKPPLALIRRVFRDRKAELADAEGVDEGVRTIKADAADRLFGVSCENVTWAIIDSGIAANHPAFRDHGASSKRTRVRAILDFTLIEQIRNFDLIAGAPDSPEREQAIEKVVSLLKDLPDLPAEPNFEEIARGKLKLIAGQLDAQLQPDWNLIEPLIRRKSDKKDPDLASGHGTHVAGILAADWRDAKQPDKTILRGVCKDINLYDLRVIQKKDRESTEFAILAALEYVQFANRRILGMEQVIHGVNISLSIPHDVHNYACGATPICVACDNLVGSGVVVVAAGGNRGWNEQEIGFGNFVFCSITDPGNAEEVITVGATHRIKPHTYGVSFFSSRGPTGDGRAKPDLVAPGEKVRGPVLEDADDDLDGTSMAAPFVSGAAAMLMARHSELLGNPRRIKQILCASATDLGREKYFQGHGLVDVLRALQSV
jgi:serine protease AprX